MTNPDIMIQGHVLGMANAAFHDPERRAYRNRLLDPETEQGKALLDAVTAKWKPLGADDLAIAKLVQVQAYKQSSPEYWSMRQDDQAAIYGAQLAADPANLISPMPTDAGRALETTIVTVAQRPLLVSRDMRARGMVDPIGDYGVTIREWQTATDQGPADVTMDLITDKPYERTGFAPAAVPIPLHHTRFSFTDRQLRQAGTMGVSLDTGHAQVAAEKIGQAEENMVLFGAPSIQYQNFSLPGLTNHPDTINADYSTTPGPWATDPMNAYETVRLATASLRERLKTGPYGVYVSQAEYELTLKKIGAENQRTAREAILELPNIARFEPSYHLAANTILVVDLNPTTAELIIVQETSTIPFSINGGVAMVWIVWAGKSLKVRSTQPDDRGFKQVGVLFGTGI